VNIKERMLMTVLEYSVLKEKMEEHRCGWFSVTGLDWAGLTVWTVPHRRCALRLPPNAACPPL
jgi:hypothetical protein